MLELDNVDISNLKQQIGNELIIEQDEKFDVLDEVKFTSPLPVKLHLINTGEVIKITGHLEGEVLLQCIRCLEDFNYNLQWDFKIDLYERKEKVEVEYYNKQLKANELEKSFYQGKNIDLKEEIRQQIILSLPMKTICKEDCLGLCSNCGVNLNKITCGCSK